MSESAYPAVPAPIFLQKSPEYYYYYAVVIIIIIIIIIIIKGISISSSK